MSDYTDLVDEDERQKAQVREAMKNKKKKLKARDIAKAIIRQEKSLANNRGDASEAGNNVSEGNTTDMESGNASRMMPNKQNKVPRSLSIQNNSTKVSSFSDATNQNYSDDNLNASRSKKTAAVDAASKPANKETALTSDIMELISEEELSVCRSEGSPPRKKNKRRKEEGNQNTSNFDMNNNSQATALTKFAGGKGATGGAAGKGSSVPASASNANGKKTANSKSNSGGNSNFRIRPERSKRLSSVQEASGTLTTNG